MARIDTGAGGESEIDDDAREEYERIMVMGKVP